MATQKQLKDLLVGIAKSQEQLAEVAKVVNAVTSTWDITAVATDAWYEEEAELTKAQQAALDNAARRQQQRAEARRRPVWR